MFNIPLTLLAALPLASVWAAPMCSLKPATSTGAALASSTSTSTGSNTSSGSSSTSKNSTVGDEVVAATWYAGWHGDDFPPENVSWSKYTAATYAFA